MAERLGEALLDLETRDRGFDRGIDKAERKAQGLGRLLDDTARRAAAMGKALALAATASVTALGVMVKRTIDNADAMSKNAQRVGVSTEALSRLAWAGNLSDVSIGALTGSMARLSNLMSQVASGQGKDTQAIFEALGISVSEADGRLRSIDAVMMNVADVFAAMEDGADKTAIAVRLFGRSGAELIPLLNNGKAGLADMAAEADRLGITISTDMGRNAEAFNDAMTRVQAAFQGVVVQLADQLLPYLNELGQKLNDPETVAAAQRMASGVVGAMEQMVAGIRSALEWITWLAEGWERLSKLPGLMDGYNLFGQPIGGDGDAARTRQTLGDDEFENRFNPPLPGKTDRLRPPPRKPVIFNFGKLPDSGSGAETKALEDQRNAVEELIARLEDELAVMRESDPVQREMLALRNELADATPKQTEAVRALIEAQHREREALEANQEAMRNARDVFGDFIRDFENGIKQGKSIWQSFGDAAVSAIQRVTSRLLDDFLDAIFQINGATGGSGGGLFGGLLSTLFGGGLFGGRGLNFFPPAPSLSSAASSAAVPLGSTGGSATVQVIDQRRGGAAIREERATGPNGEEMVRLIVADELDSRLTAYDDALPRKIEGKVGAMQRDPRARTGTWK